MGDFQGVAMQLLRCFVCFLTSHVVVVYCLKPWSPHSMLFWDVSKITAYILIHCSIHYSTISPLEGVNKNEREKSDTECARRAVDAIFSRDTVIYSQCLGSSEWFSVHRWYTPYYGALWD